MLRLIAILLGCWLFIASAAHAGLPGLGDADNWRLKEVTWADQGGVPLDSQFNTGLSAHYNLAYGATVLGLTVRVPDDNRYYAVVASCSDSQLTTLDYLGPFDSAARWDSGPYHVAAGLPDGRLVVWLTAPNEYPVPLAVSYNYIPGTPISCQAYPPSPMTKDWAAWTTTVAYAADPTYPGIEVVTLNGRGNIIASLDWLTLDRYLSQICLREYALGEHILPGLLISDAGDVYSAWHHPTWGWRAEKLGGENLIRTRLWLSPPARQPTALALFFDEADTHDAPLIQQINITATANTGISARWGKSAVLDDRYTYDKVAFIDSVQLPWPLVVQSDETDIWISYYAPDPRDKPGTLAFASNLLHAGERGIVGSEEVAMHPILSVTGAAHWKTGTPEIFWVQLGGGRLMGEGALYHLEYVATGQYDRTGY